MNQKEQKLLSQKAKSKLKYFQAVFRKFRRLPGAEVDRHIHTLHDHIFAETDCTVCANCCKVGTPVFSNKDVDMLAGHLQMTSGQFVQKYLQQDADGDRVLKQTPCSFLGEDNLCKVYEYRPFDCRQFPHTRRKPAGPFLNVVLTNTAVCPAAMQIVEGICKTIESGYKHDSGKNDI